MEKLLLDIKGRQQQTKPRKLIHTTEGYMQIQNHTEASCVIVKLYKGDLTIL